MICPHCNAPDDESELTVECWSCKESVTRSEMLDNDGYCPQCQAELISEPDDDVDD